MVDKYEDRLDVMMMEIACDVNTLGKMVGPAGKKIVDQVIKNLNDIHSNYAMKYLELLREGKS